MFVDSEDDSNNSEASSSNADSTALSQSDFVDSEDDSNGFNSESSSSNTALSQNDSVDGEDDSNSESSSSNADSTALSQSDSVDGEDDSNASSSNADSTKLSDAMAKIATLEHDITLLKKELSEAKKKSELLEQQVRILSEAKTSDKRCSPPSSNRSRKKDLPSIVSCYTVPKLDANIVTADDILNYGLRYVGFGEERQKVVEKTSVDRFKAHYGPEPRTVKDLMSDLCSEFPDTEFKELLMGLNWLKLYDIEHVLAGRWNYDESVCRAKCRETTRRIESFRKNSLSLMPACSGLKKSILSRSMVSTLSPKNSG
jgi:hypothetical protein